MTTATPTLDLSGKKDWAGALRALRRLLSEAGDTAQVFRIMRALNAGVAKAGYERLLATPSGGRMHIVASSWQSDSLTLISSTPVRRVASAQLTGIF